MEQQDPTVKESKGVRFENVKIGKRCVVVTVSTQGEEVYGKDIEVDDYTSWHGGQMSDQSLQNLPKIYDDEREKSSMKDQSVKNIGSSRHMDGAGRTLREAPLTAAGATSPT